MSLGYPGHQSEGHLSNDLAEVQQSAVSLWALRPLFDRLAEPAIWVSREAQLVHANPAACRLFTTRRHLLSANLISVPGWDLSASLWQTCWSSAQQGRPRGWCVTFAAQPPLSLRVTLTAMNAKYGCLLLQARSLPLGRLAECAPASVAIPPGQGLGHTGSALNRLSSSRTELWQKTMLEAIDLGIVSLSLQGQVINFNRAFVRLWCGCPSSEHLKTRAELQVFIDQQLLPGCRCELEVDRFEADLERDRAFLNLANGRILEYWRQPQKLGGMTIGHVWSFRDVTRSRRAELALQQSEAKFRTFAETTNVIVFIKQGNQLCYVNPAAEAITGYCREELLARPDIEALIHEQGEVNYAGLDYQSEVTHRQEIKVLTKAGQDCWLDCAFGVIEFAGDLAVIGTATDITQQKQAEAILQQALERECHLSDLRAQFLHVISHEFRSPLNDIAIATSALMRYHSHWTEADKIDCIEGVRSDVQRLSELLDEVLSISREESFHTYSQTQPLNVEQFCAEILDELERRDGEHRFSFIRQGDCATVLINQRLLRLVLTNLLSNAVKYSPASETIQLCLHCEQTALTFQVQDHGMGISATDQARIFSPFNRGSNVQHIPGLGLGLTIVKMLVNFYGGSIEVTSEIGAGTLFRVMLPQFSTKNESTAQVQTDCN
ncbi:PAS domain-containing sensor histidine kinase [Romeria aff. gracilis LEGE 07310]|uniref:histidine kinase n=1 Tax=Vasconcelosia minhoensis LEGE 07310 TaxID=915328 RepID=A0A8J7DMV5_9CYAN|nr:PAS domain-containing sensor histidine kinase [Romeria gracilis]MBE9077345.1 PAS domain-containing sensor histidine kinase [Romeria aff. gracilis LEGE 07310]